MDLSDHILSDQKLTKNVDDRIPMDWSFHTLSALETAIEENLAKVISANSELQDLIKQQRLKKVAEDTSKAVDDAKNLEVSLAAAKKKFDFSTSEREGGLSLKAAWPEMDKVLKATQAWCDKNGTPGPPDASETDEEHRLRKIALHPQPGFGLVNVPIAPSSAEWNGKAAQDCIGAEKAKHERRGTWDLKSVVEL